MPYNKVVICGAGFIGSNIARRIASAPTSDAVGRLIQLSSRNPEPLQEELRQEVPQNRLLPPVRLDVTKPHTLTPAFESAKVVVSLGAMMHGTPEQFEELQWHGAENVARAAKRVDAKLIHFSAIGADPKSSVPYERTKGLAEESILKICPNATIIRPSLVFGPGDSFFNRFAQLARYLPFMPVYGDGASKFQPVYVGDLARAVEIISRLEPKVESQVAGTIIEAGGPDVLTFKQLMELVLKYTHRRRPIVPIPYAFGTLQGAILEQLPVNLFTVTRSQVEQLKKDNIVTQESGHHRFSFKELIRQGDNEATLRGLSEILPQYLH